MRLHCLAGAYAGQVREYSPIAGLAALKSGTATRIGDTGPVQAVPVQPPTIKRSPVAATAGGGWKKKTR